MFKLLRFMQEHLMVFLLIGIMIYTISTPAEFSADKGRAQYIENSFNSFKDKFFEKARVIPSPSGLLLYYVANETEPKTTSYYLIAHNIGDIVTRIYAKKEIKINDHLVETYQETIYLHRVGEPFQYDIKHTILNQDDNCSERKLEPIEIWDEVIEKTIHYNEEDRVQYIKDSFSTIQNTFYTKAKIEREGYMAHYHMKDVDNDNPSITYYLTVGAQGLPMAIIISIHVRKEIELGDNIVEWYTEGIYLDQIERKYQYTVEHGIMDRNNNCEQEDLSPAKIWDVVIKKLLGKKGLIIKSI